VDNGFEGKFSVIRRDMLTSIKKDDRIGKQAKWLFLILTAECRGGKYTSIDRESIQEDWGISSSQVSRSAKELEEAGYLLKTEYSHNRTKKKYVAKYVDSNYCLNGHKDMMGVAIGYDDVLRYDDEVYTEEEVSSLQSVPDALKPMVTREGTLPSPGSTPVSPGSKLPAGENTPPSSV
jgi:hypothetical protein